MADKKNIIHLISESVDTLENEFRQRLYSYLLYGATAFAWLLFFTKGMKLTTEHVEFWMRLSFCGLTSTFLAIHIAQKTYRFYSSVLMYMLFLVISGLHFALPHDAVDPALQYNIGLLIISTFLSPKSFTKFLFISIGCVYLIPLTGFFQLIGIADVINPLFFDRYYALSIFGTLCFIYATLLFTYRLKSAQQNLIVELSKIHRDEQKNNVSKQIIAGFAHEINNPMAIIVGSIDLMQRKYEKDPFSCELKDRHEELQISFKT